MGYLPLPFHYLLNYYYYFDRDYVAWVNLELQRF